MSTIAILRSLKESGLPESQAEAILNAIEARDTALVTKEHLDAKLYEVRAEIVRWLFLVILGQTGVLLAAGYFLLSNLR